MTIDWIRAERLSLASFLAELTDHEWRMPSACAGWTVHDVAAHLTLSTRDTWGSVLKGVAKARGNWHRANANAARTRATRYDRHELVAQLRDTAGSTHHAPGSSLLDALVDVLVHGQDIAHPLGRQRTMPFEPATAALDHVRTSRFYGARFARTRVVATDHDWSAGEGPREVRGSISDLLLTATGRTAIGTLVETAH